MARLLGEAFVTDGSCRRLSRCWLCDDDAVALLDWREDRGETWRLLLRCGACGRVREVVAREDELAELAGDLERHAIAIGEALAAFERRCMEDELLVLREALARDLIDASDFAR
jgi:hypothetical protein